LVLLVDKGELIAIGTHEDLLRESPQYRLVFEGLPETRKMLEAIPLSGGVSA
jgi:hypothetical protein